MSSRIVALAALIFVAYGPVRAQTVTLVEDDLKDQCFRMEMSMELKGKITVRQDGKPISFSRTAQAKHVFLERFMDATGGVGARSARHYVSGDVNLTEDKDTTKRSLKPGLYVAQRVKEETVVYRLGAAFTQDELETTEHFDTLHLGGLLPGKTLKAGETWAPTPRVVQALCDFDGLLEHDLAGKLIGVKGGIAHLSITGKAKGISFGAEVNLLVQALAEYDTSSKRITRISWVQSDQREQGPVSPGLSAEVKMEIVRTPIAEPKELNKFVLVPIPNVPPENRTALVYRDAKNRFQFQHSRDWHLVGVKDEQIVLRLMERGDFVAQVTLTPRKNVAAEALPSLNEFAKLMSEAPGWDEEKVLEKTDKVDAGPGLRVLRIAAEGDLGGVKATQFFYHVSTGKGEQMIVTFTMTPGQVTKLDGRDVPLLRSIRFASTLEGATARGE